MVWVVAPMVAAAAAMVAFIAARWPLTPLIRVTEPLPPPPPVRILPAVIEPAAVIPPDRRELEQ